MRGGRPLLRQQGLGGDDSEPVRGVFRRGTTSTSGVDQELAGAVELHDDPVADGPGEEDVLVFVEAAGRDDQPVVEVDDRAAPQEGALEPVQCTLVEPDGLVAVHTGLEAHQLLAVGVVEVPLLVVLGVVVGEADAVGVGVAEVASGVPGSQDLDTEGVVLEAGALDHDAKLLDEDLEFLEELMGKPRGRHLTGPFMLSISVKPTTST